MKITVKQLKQLIREAVFQTFSEGIQQIKMSGKDGEKTANVFLVTMKDAEEIANDLKTSLKEFQVDAKAFAEDPGNMKEKNFGYEPQVVIELSCKNPRDPRLTMRFSVVIRHMFWHTYESENPSTSTEGYMSWYEDNRLQSEKWGVIRDDDTFNKFIDSVIAKFKEVYNINSQPITESLRRMVRQEVKRQLRSNR